MMVVAVKGKVEIIDQMQDILGQVAYRFFFSPVVSFDFIFFVSMIYGNIYKYSSRFYFLF